MSQISPNNLSRYSTAYSLVCNDVLLGSTLADNSTAPAWFGFLNFLLKLPSLDCQLE